MDNARKLKQDVYIRICKDSGFKLEPTDAAILAAKVLECHPLEIWTALDFDNMTRIANGTHPICKKLKKIVDNIKRIIYSYKYRR